MKALKDHFNSLVVSSLKIRFGGYSDSDSTKISFVIKDNIQGYADAINAFNEFVVNNSKYLQENFSDLEITVRPSLNVDMGDFHVRHTISPADMNKLNKVMQLTLPEYIKNDHDVTMGDNENSYMWYTTSFISKDTAFAYIKEFAQYDLPIIINFELTGEANEVTVKEKGKAYTRNILTISLESRFKDHKKVKNAIQGVIDSNENLQSIIERIRNIEEM